MAGAENRDIDYSWLNARPELTPEGIKQARTKFGWSQQEFATLLGISHNTLYKWEKGKKRPTAASRILLLIAHHAPHTLIDVHVRMTPKPVVLRDNTQQEFYERQLDT